MRSEDEDATEAVDPGWALHETLVDGEHAERWLYRYVGEVVVDEDGVPYEPGPNGVLSPVDDVAEPPWDEVPGETVGTVEDAEGDPDDEPDHGAAAVLAVATGREPHLELRRLPVRTVLVAATVVSVLLAFGVLGAVLTARVGSRPTGGTATPGSGLQLPAAVPRDSEYVRSRFLSSGDIEVDHWIASTRPISRIVLGLPAVSGSGADPVTARGVRVETWAGVLTGPRTVSRSPAVYDLDDAEEVHVSYVLSGAVARSGPGRSRALARLTSLDLSYPGGEVPRTVELRGGRLLAAACTTASRAQPRPCGQAEGRSWRVRLEPPERRDVVLAQLDLL